MHIWTYDGIFLWALVPAATEAEEPPNLAFIGWRAGQASGFFQMPEN